MKEGRIKQFYTSPEVEVIEAQTQTVLCESTDATLDSMNGNDGNW